MNSCSFTVWVGLQPNGGIPLLVGGGFELAAGGKNAVTAPAAWGGRFWGRTGNHDQTLLIDCFVGFWWVLQIFGGSQSECYGFWDAGCNFDGSGKGSCLTGDCGGMLECGGAGGDPPASLAEITLDGANGDDFYDISLVDGYNLPLAMTPSGGTGNCGAPGCTSNLNNNCPGALQVCSVIATPALLCSLPINSPRVCSFPDQQTLFLMSQSRKLYPWYVVIFELWRLILVSGS